MRVEKIRKIYSIFSLQNQPGCADRYYISKAVKTVRSELRDNADETDIRLEYYAAAVAFLSRQRRHSCGRITFATRLVRAYRRSAAPLLKHHDLSEMRNTE